MLQAAESQPQGGHGPADSLTSRIKATVSRRARAGGSRPPMTAMEAAWQWNTSGAVGEIVLFGHY